MLPLEQIILTLFLMLLSGASAYLMGRLTKLGDAQAETKTVVAAALKDIEHLREKANTHTSHIDTLFEMKTMMAEMGAAVRHMAETQPEMLRLMNQLASIALRKAA